MRGVLMGEGRCRVCGLLQGEPIWGDDGQCPTYNICSCCGCEFGYEDCTPDGVLQHRARWTAEGRCWFTPSERPADWDSEAQLALATKAYVRVLPGLPAVGPEALSFSHSGSVMHSEGFVIEFTLADGQKWVGNFQGAFGDANSVLPVEGRPSHVLVVSAGQGYVVDAERRIVSLKFGGGIRHVVDLPERGITIFGDLTGFECVGREGLIWQSPRVSWDGMAELAVVGDALRGVAFNPFDEAREPFSIDLNTGEPTGGSYPRELPQP